MYLDFSVVLETFSGVLPLSGICSVPNVDVDFRMLVLSLVLLRAPDSHSSIEIGVWFACRVPRPPPPPPCSAYRNCFLVSLEIDVDACGGC